MSVKTQQNRKSSLQGNKYQGVVNAISKDIAVFILYCDEYSQSEGWKAIACSAVSHKSHYNGFLVFNISTERVQKIYDFKS